MRYCNQRLFYRKIKKSYKCGQFRGIEMTEKELNILYWKLLKLSESDIVSTWTDDQKQMLMEVSKCLCESIIKKYHPNENPTDAIAFIIKKYGRKK